MLSHTEWHLRHLKKVFRSHGTSSVQINPVYSTNNVRLAYQCQSSSIACDSPLAAGMSLEEVQDLFHVKYGDNSRETPRQMVSVEAA